MLVTGPETDQALSGAVDWLRALLLGSIGTTAAILAIAAIGLLMLSGRIPVRRGTTVIIGCFILFSASIIAQGLMSAPSSDTFAAARPAQPPPDYTPAVPKPEPYDPYAGAAVHAQQPRDLFR